MINISVLFINGVEKPILNHWQGKKCLVGLEVTRWSKSDNDSMAAQTGKRIGQN